MLRCTLCGPISRNQADFTISVGKEDCPMEVCRWCEQDLRLLGFKFNQVVRLPRSSLRRILEPPCLTSLLFVSHVLKMKRKA